MGRSPCCSKEGVNRGAWTATEDKILTDYIKVHGEGKWRNIPRQSGLKRCGKSCRLRWLNYLKPGIKRGNITVDEEDLIIRLHRLLGNRWSLIAGRLPGRTDNEIKNYWNTNLSKRTQGKPPTNQDQSRIEKKRSNIKPNEHPETWSEQPLVPQQQKTEKQQGNEVKAAYRDTDLVQNITAESESSDGSFVLSAKEEDCLESKNDFNAGDMTFPEILATDFINLSDCSIDDVIPEELLEKWANSDLVEVNMDTDFGSVAAFLDSAEEWLI